MHAPIQPAARERRVRVTGRLPVLAAAQRADRSVTLPVQPLITDSATSAPSIRRQRRILNGPDPAGQSPARASAMASHHVSCRLPLGIGLMCPVGIRLGPADLATLDHAPKSRARPARSPADVVL